MRAVLMLVGIVLVFVGALAIVPLGQGPARSARGEPDGRE